MPKTSTLRVPSYRRHKPTGQAVVTVNGQDIYLGKWNTAGSRAEYDRLIAEFLANGRRLQSDADGTVVEVLNGYRKFAEDYYRKDGRVTSEYAGIKEALKLVRELYGRTTANEFGPLAFTADQVERAALSPDGSTAGATHTREADPLTVTRRLQRDGRWREIEPVRDQMMRDCRKQGMNREQAQAWTYAELDRLYPPLSAPGCQTVAEPQPAADGHLRGLGDIPVDWPTLPETPHCRQS